MPTVSFPSAMSVVAYAVILELSLSQKLSCLT
jgi:hypothetical protein